VGALAETAVRRRYARPKMHDGDEIEIVHRRHPVIEVFIDEPFIPNNVYQQLGRSPADHHWAKHGWQEYRPAANALICILAQMGSFVPAKARSPLLDRAGPKSAHPITWLAAARLSWWR
jgi:DNA mismatch repair protein MutS